MWRAFVLGSVVLLLALGVVVGRGIVAPGCPRPGPGEAVLGSAVPLSFEKGCWCGIC